MFKWLKRWRSVPQSLQFSLSSRFELASSTSDPRVTNPPTYVPQNGFHRDMHQERRPVNRVSLHFDRVRKAK